MSGRNTADIDGSQTALGYERVQGLDLLKRSSTGYDLIQWIDASMAVWTVRPSDFIRNESFEFAEPVRYGVDYQNRRNQHGLYLWPRTRSHVWYESRLEMESLLQLDFEGYIDRIAAQPFRILFRAGASCVSHVPDFFGVGSDGQGVVYNVKPSKFLTAEVRAQFDLAAEICAAVGWHHEVITEAHPLRAANLRALRMNRHASTHPSDTDFQHALSVFEQGRSIGEGRLMLNRRFPALAMPVIKHLLWHGYLDTNLDERLDASTVLTTTTKGASCCAQ